MGGNSGNASSGQMYGVRGGGKPGTGAFLGQPVTGGIAQLGQILASSTQFFSCAAENAFTNIYGRQLNVSDAVAFNQVVANFQSSQSYDNMILDLISMPSWEKGN